MNEPDDLSDLGDFVDNDELMEIIENQYNPTAQKQYLNIELSIFFIVFLILMNI